MKTNNNKIDKSEFLYGAIRRWHFYAGVFVLPFLFLLSLSGLLMLLTKPIEPLFHQTLMQVQPQPKSLPAAQLLATVQQQFEHGSVKLYMPPTQLTESARFSVITGSHGDHGGHGQPSITVYVNPYNGEILGSLDPGQSIYTFIKDFHGSLFLGDIGDALIEIAAGLAVLMIITGVYMAWPKARWQSLKSQRILTSRESWRRVHRIVGLVVGLPLLLFLLSGLAWTNFWGGQLVQPWGSLPGTSYKAAKDKQRTEQKVEHKADHNHQAMAQHGEHQVPWTMQHTLMPMSVSSGDRQLTLDSAITIAKQQDFDNFRVHLPQSDNAVWTISATTIAGDITNPLAERTIHLDRFSGEILTDVAFADYPKLGQAMATFVPFHQGDLGLWNWLLNIVLVSMVIVMLLSGTLMWWKRRTNNQSRLAPPTAQPRANKIVVGLMILIALCFPLSALALVVMLALDWVVISRIKSLRKLLK